MPENIPDWKIERAIDRLVVEGKAVRTIMDGEPAVQLTEAGKNSLKEDTGEVHELKRT